MDPNVIKLNKVVSNKGEIKMIRHNVFIIILIILILGILFIIGKFGQDGLAFFIFIIFLLIPIIVMYRNNLPRYIPYPLRSLFEDGLENQKDKVINNKSISKLSKQIFVIVAIILLIIGSIILLINMKGDLVVEVPAEVSIKNGTLSKVFATMICLVIAGILVIKLDGL